MSLLDWSGTGLRTDAAGIGFKLPAVGDMPSVGLNASPSMLLDLEKYGGSPFSSTYLNTSPNALNLGNGPGSGGLGGFMNNYGGLALGALQGVGNLFMGMKQYGMAKDALKESKRQFGLNYDAQKKLTNSRLEDRQRARIAADPNAHQSVDEYMNRYGVR